MEGTDSCSLSFKVASLHLKPLQNAVDWSKLIWSPSIPPSRSFVAWRLIHNRMPTNENLNARGCVSISVCSLCYKHDESSDHLFLTCEFARAFWGWLCSILQQNIDVSSI